MRKEYLIVIIQVALVTLIEVGCIVADIASSICKKYVENDEESVQDEKEKIYD